MKVTQFASHIALAMVHVLNFGDLYYVTAWVILVYCGARQDSASSAQPRDMNVLMVV